MTTSQRKVLTAYPEAVCFRTAAERRQGVGFHVRLGSGRFARVIGSGPTRGKAWVEAAERLQHEENP